VAAQALLDEQLRTAWAQVLEGLLEQAHPYPHQISAPLGLSYYWSASETEYATDVLFRSPAALARLYPLFVRHGLSTFQSPDVLRFLGKSRPELFNAELKGRLQHRPEGVRLKHVVNGNSLKIYDKEGQILRVEATINQPRDFRVFRPTRDDPTQGMKWQELRWGVADLFRRAQVCQAANRRYLEALSSVSGTTPLAQEAATLCRAGWCSKAAVTAPSIPGRLMTPNFCKPSVAESSLWAACVMPICANFFSRPLKTWSCSAAKRPPSVESLPCYEPTASCEKSTTLTVIT
jgi:hypothetical protein